MDDRVGHRTRLTLFGALFAAIAFLPAHRRFVFMVAPDWMLAGLLGVLLCGLLLAAPGGGRLSWRDDWPAGLLALGLAAGLVNSSRPAQAWAIYGLIILVLAVCHLAGKLLTKDVRLHRGVAVTIAVIAGSVALFGLFEVIFAINPLYEGRFVNPFYALYQPQSRPVATQFNPAPLGTFLLLSWPFSAWLAAHGRDRREVATGTISLALGLACLFLTYSRGALIGLVGTVVLLLWMRRRFRLLVAGLLVVLGLSAAATFLPYPASKYGFVHILGLSGGLESSWPEPGEMTTEDWRRVKKVLAIPMALTMAREHPLTGGGFEQFRHDYHELLPEGVTDTQARTADNAYLTLLAETGLAGTLALVMATTALLRRGAAALGGPSAAFATAAILALTAALLNAPGYNLFSWTGPWMYTCLLLGFLAGFGSPRGSVVA